MQAVERSVYMVSGYSNVKTISLIALAYGYLSITICLKIYLINGS